MLKIFKDELGLVKELKVKFHMKDSCTPRHYKARPVPYVLREKSEG